jgi:DNA-3-methyladenine glycosylase II
METRTLALPAGYHAGAILEFHGRDREELAEQVRGSVLRKGLMIDGTPVVLQATLTSGAVQWLVQADAPAATVTRLLPRLEGSLRAILGLDSTAERFEANLPPDDPLASLVARQAGLHIPQAATPFEALSWGITGQQITVAFAVQLRSSLIRLAGTRHSSGLWCHPEPEAIAALDSSLLRQHRFSQAKAEALLRMARLVTAGELPLEQWRQRTLQPADVQEMTDALLAVKGIGPWTVNYTLLRGYGWADCLMHGDVAIQRALQQQLDLPARPTAKEAEQLLQRYAPYRSLASAHLWASLRLAA